MKYDINYFYEILSKVFGEDNLRLCKQDDKILAVSLTNPMYLELYTKETKVKHFAEIEIIHVNFSEHLITFGYNDGRFTSSAFRYDNIVDFEVDEEKSVFTFELDDGMIVVFK